MERISKTPYPETDDRFNYKPPLVKGLHKLLAGIFIRLSIVAIAFKHYYYPGKVKWILKELESLRRKYMGDYNITKLMKVDGKYYWDMHAPGWPSRAFITYNEGEMNRIMPFRNKTDYLNSMILAITKKCPLQCRHCYEWDELNKDEKLTLDDLKNIVDKFQKNGKGVTQIQFSGGEPLSRFNDLIELLKSAKKGTDFWVVTSGFHLTLSKARELKRAGLTGLAISLDHFNPSLHNEFRGSEESFKWVIKAVEHAHQAKLVVILSLCPTKRFVSEDNMKQYARLAKKLGAAFILMIEPRDVGRYAGQHVALTEAQEKILENFFISMNYDPEYADMPAVSYHGYHQRRVGCFGSGDRYLYIDTDGDMHVCPFCRQKLGNILATSVDESVGKLKEVGCHKFKHATI
jgi:MoaA/NifB/PqqE/SkfB family radical SAM enzyme